MKWSSKLPSTPGWYWVFMSGRPNGHGRGAALVEVFCNFRGSLSFCISHEEVECIDVNPVFTMDNYVFGRVLGWHGPLDIEPPAGEPIESNI